MAGTNGIRAGPSGVLALLALAAAFASAAAGTGDGTDRQVQRRVAAMFAAQAALDRLGDMSGGRRMFDAGEARAARAELIAFARALPDRFRRNRTDPASRALPVLWLAWDEFRDQADHAERAARGLETRSLNRLRAGLPDLVDACIACHRRFRRP